jgi:hypothetical protein
LKDVLFFPNPFTNKLNVQYSDQFAEMNTISVRDMTGKSIIMLNSSLDDFIALDILKDLQIGVYYIDICSSKGQRTICRLIKG